ncbi:MAG: DUF4433 domain-containing protein [Balneola sp.]
MVHWENVEHILEYGLCCRGHANADPDYINIGHTQLIADRHVHPIPIAGAGNLGEYVPFYFAGHSPMLYLIMNGYSGVHQRKQEDIVYMISSVDRVEQEGLEFVFSDRNAKLKFAQFYSDIDDFENLDWDIILAKMWRNTDQKPDKQDLKQAEFLIRNEMPVTCIEQIVVKTTARKTQIEAMIAQHRLQIPVVVDDKLELYY